jgi:hypothetical protein
MMSRDNLHLRNDSNDFFLTGAFTRFSPSISLDPENNDSILKKPRVNKIRDDSLEVEGCHDIRPKVNTPNDNLPKNKGAQAAIISPKGYIQTTKTHPKTRLLNFLAFLQ